MSRSTLILIVTIAVTLALIIVVIVLGPAGGNPQRGRQPFSVPHGVMAVDAAVWAHAWAPDRR